MKTKNIKVAYANHYTDRTIRTVPKLQIEGKWLEKLGFSVGTTVAVEYEEGSVRIRLLTAEEEENRRQNTLRSDLERKKAEIERLQRELSHHAQELPMVAETSNGYSPM